jgi:hypothetical protein
MTAVRKKLAPPAKAASAAVSKVASEPAPFAKAVPTTVSSAKAASEPAPSARATPATGSSAKAAAKPSPSVEAASAGASSAKAAPEPARPAALASRAAPTATVAAKAVPTAKAASAEPSGKAAEASLVEEARLALAERRASSVSILQFAWTIPAAAGLAALLVFGLGPSGGTGPAPPAPPAKAAAEAGPARGPSQEPAHAAPQPSGPAPSAAQAPAPRDEGAPRAVPTAPADTAPTAPPSADSRVAALPLPDNRPQASGEPQQALPLKLSSEEVAAHLDRGEEKLKRGDLAAARLYFERVALAGDRRGALGMARTYDPAVLAGLPVLGPGADADAARQWYQRAATQRAAR